MSRGVEAEAGEDGAGPRRGCVGADIGEAGMDFGDPMGVLGGERFMEQGGALRIGGEHGLQQADLPGRRFLGDGGDARPRRQADGVVALEYESQQSRLARAVAPDQADLVAGGNHGAGAVEQNSPGDAVGEVVDA